jgi:hypothetical protein
MDRLSLDYDTVKELFIRMSNDYGYFLTVNEKTKTVSMKVQDGEHELMFSFVFGNPKIFVVDEWDAMSTLNISNLQYLPTDITYRVSKWKKQISERA